MLKYLTPVLKCLHVHEVRYVVIGGIATVMYGVPRTTFDVDILIDPTQENAQRLLLALQEAGFGTAQMITAKQLIEQDITIFNDRLPIDVMTHIPGIEFANAWENKRLINYKGQEFYILSKEDLLTSKRATGRQKDKSDVEAIEASHDDILDAENK